MLGGEGVQLQGPLRGETSHVRLKLCILDGSLSTTNKAWYGAAAKGVRV